MAKPDDIPEIVERGYVLAYSRSAGDFNVNAMALASALFFILTFVLAIPPLLIPAVAALCVAYYYYPLKESMPRIGAGQYGLFIDGLGLLSWRMIKNIDMVSYTSRVAQTHELHIHLSVPIEQALLADWRNLPIWRLLMKLPWHMKKDEIIRIPLEPFEPRADTIRVTLLRIWDYCR
ncbi:MAG: hypothetical protein KTR19_02175 [Hyphomicrobiales bacterium]|nr:hypothetical protein [Hyphomicrobiales bacterium]